MQEKTSLSRTVTAYKVAAALRFPGPRDRHTGFRSVMGYRLPDELILPYMKGIQTKAPGESRIFCFAKYEEAEAFARLMTSPNTITGVLQGKAEIAVPHPYKKERRYVFECIDVFRHREGGAGQVLDFWSGRLPVRAIESSAVCMCGVFAESFIPETLGALLTEEVVCSCNWRKVLKENENTDLVLEWKTDIEREERTSI